MVLKSHPNSVINTDSKFGKYLKEISESINSDEMGSSFLHWIDEIEFDTPEDNYSKLRKFISDAQELIHEANFYRKYPEHFHENTYINIETGLNFYKELLNKIDE